MQSYALQGHLPFNPKFQKFHLVHQNNGTAHFSLVLPEYSGPALMVVHFDRSCHFGWLDWNVPFHLTKLLSPVPLFCILLAKTITKCAMAWVGSRPFIMLVKRAFYACSNTWFMPKNAQIMLDSQNNATENALFYFRQKRTNSGIMLCAYRQLNKVKSA